jgi:hypothetical protein
VGLGFAGRALHARGPREGRQRHRILHRRRQALHHQRCRRQVRAFSFFCSVSFPFPLFLSCACTPAGINLLYSRMAGCSKCGTTRTRRACRPWRDTPTTSRSPASTPLCPSSSPVPRMAPSGIYTHTICAIYYPLSIHSSFIILFITTCTLTCRLWNSNTYRLEKTLNYGMERIWALGYLKGSNKLVLGYDEGCVMIKVNLNSRPPPTAWLGDMSINIIVFINYFFYYAIQLRLRLAGQRGAGGEHGPGG